MCLAWRVLQDSQRGVRTPRAPWLGRMPGRKQVAESDRRAISGSVSYSWGENSHYLGASPKYSPFSPTDRRFRPSVGEISSFLGPSPRFLLFSPTDRRFRPPVGETSSFLGPSPKYLAVFPHGSRILPFRGGNFIFSGAQPQVFAVFPHDIANSAIFGKND